MVKITKQGITEARRLLLKTVKQISNLRDEDVVVSLRNRGEEKAFLIPPRMFYDYLLLRDIVRLRGIDLIPGVGSGKSDRGDSGKSDRESQR